MKRTEIDAAIARAISNAETFGVALPKWVAWAPEEFGANADGIRAQRLGWKVVDFGLGDFEHCGLVVLSLCAPISDAAGEPVTALTRVDGHDYPVTQFSRKYLFVQAGATEPHHFHRQKTRKEVTVVAGAPVRFELAWADSDTALSSTRPVDVQVDGITHHLPADGSVTLYPGETITLPGDLSHIIQVMGDGKTDTIMLETSTANNDGRDNIFPFITPTAKPVEEDAKPRYQLLDEHTVPAAK
ncbi:MAG: D-lyxose/D-mannose family sugar isomerase [Cyanobacteria bacterium REEB67]|nr:D-lyxose/D-mannose family sugar isomerase [Cyanobacteria bacterium REEB67]